VDKLPSDSERETPKNQEDQISMPPPPLRTGRKKKAFGKLFGQRQPLSEKSLSKPGPSATTSVFLEVKDTSENQVIIAVMGPTSSGKSSFIGTATKSKSR